MSDTVRIIIVIVSFAIFLFSYYWRKKANENRKRENLLKSQIKYDASTSEMLKYNEKENDILLKIAQIEREFNAKLDTKITTLNILIEKAETIIQKLDGHLETNATIKINTDSTNNKELPRQEQINQKIGKLHQAGLTPAEIAQHLKMMQGEVELVLSLLKKKQNE